MTYRPAETVFGPPWPARIPTMLYVVIAVAVVLIVVAGEMSPSNSALHIYIVEKDVHRVLGARTLAAMVCLSALAAIFRTGMRGVRVRGDGVEYRDVLSFGWPRVRRFRWAQIDCVVLDQPGSIALDLWDGSRTFLPAVGDPDGLAMMLETVATARAIPVRGGKGIDEIPESGEFDG
ncbi:MAG: hypothetical protein R3B13_03110 [Polyangiaceae bacterium]